MIQPVGKFKTQNSDFEIHKNVGLASFANC